MRNSSKFNRRLLVSASIPAALLVNAGVAWAAPATVDVTASEASGVVNTKIDTAITTPANPDLTVTIGTAGEVTGGSIGFDATAYAAGEGDGAILVNNNGKIGGLDFTGVGVVKAGNTFTVVNKGEVDGDINAYNFGGAVSITNEGSAGDVYVSGSLGDVTIANAAKATVDDYITVHGDGAVSITNDGKVGDGVHGHSTGDGTVEITNNGTVGDYVEAWAGGKGAVTVANKGEIGTYVDAESNEGAITITNDGKIGGYVSAETENGAISITNSKAGQIGGLVEADSDTGDVKFVNEGVVVGTTQLTSSDSDTAAPVIAGDTTTTVTSATGGSVEGTYAGINGQLNFGVPGGGDIYQSADKDSTATVTGKVYGYLESEAGSSDYTNVVTTKVGVAPVGDGTRVDTTATSNQYVSTAGTSKVDVIGAGSLVSGDVDSYGTKASVVTVDGGTVTGGIDSGSSAYDNTYASSKVTTGTYKAGVLESTNVVTTDWDNKETWTGGDATVTVQGAGHVVGDIEVDGANSALAVIGAKAKADNNVFVDTTYYYDYSNSKVSNVTVDKAGDGTIKVVDTQTWAASKVDGDATLQNAGRIGGTAWVEAAHGDATATITGTVGGSVYASTGNGPSLGSQTQTVELALKSGAPDFSTLKVTTESDRSSFGGEATILVDTAAALQGKGVPSVGGDVNANGLGGATVTIKAGNEIAGSVGATSQGYREQTKEVQDVAADSFERSETYTALGGKAVVSNDGKVGGSAYASGLESASVTNSGQILNGVGVYSLGVEGNSTLTDTDASTATLRNVVAEVTVTPVGGDASLTNTGLILGGAEIAGSTGTVTNSGILNGTTYLGDSQYSGSAKVDATLTTTTVTVDPVVASQEYIVNQDGVSGGFSVGGATTTQYDVYSELAGLVSGRGVTMTPDDVDPTKFDLSVGGEKAVKTADIKATINLNNGSITLGDIDAQRADDGTFLTDTTVNLNGSGFLGRDATGSGASVPVLPEAAKSLGWTDSVRVLGVNELNKTGAGTFVITGADYVPAAGGVPANWTMDVGNFNIKAGEVQLGLNSDTDVFGIKGNINNDATLVLGRRVTVASSQPIGGNVVNPTREVIDGVTIHQQGNYNQSATGTTVVGINPSLIRANAYVNQSGSAPEILGPITGGVSINYFTAASTGIASTASSVTVDGDLNLAGKVAVNVSKDSLYSNGDGYTLFTYTGAGAVTATVDSAISSNFVKFGLTHDATAKTVKIAANRLSYATGATNPNAASAAVGLDSALTDVIAAIKTDNFTSVKDIANAQDIANIASALDWRLNAAQAAQVFNELSSAEIYGSLASVDQNSVFNSSLNRLTQRRGYGEALGTQLWFDPSASFVKTGGTKSGASKIKTNSYGGAFGIDVAYQENGAIGIGFGYGQHDVNARGTPESAQVRTYTIGAYATQGFGPFYGNLSFAYGFSKFEVERDLTILARTIEGDFKGKQWDAALELGYDMQAGGNLVVTPFGKLAARHWSMNGFTEEGGAGIGLNVKGASKTVFNPVLGVKAGALLGDPEKVAYRPYGKLQYTFQGNVGNRRTVQYLGGGDDFQLRGVDPNGSGLIELGIDATVNKRVGLFLSGGLGFGGHTSSGQVRAGISFGF
ncbi:autotransporter outer membrane beta-barrel domain-containing protein [Sphingobium sp. CFD-1]|uniref:autotransporter outer membrane beta-barrel domain-containing protein n=1 Tax=Sphingobium sp. CFD-1 TaxID=2878545 RepID=UPI00214D0C20|nr:autotransporter outer membrane beta-barrel domain-containing protein [Sphingobium sp. CFD-1]